MQIGYSLLPPFWGKGYATELTKAGLKYVFTKTNLDVIYGYTEVANHTSQKVLLKCGFYALGLKNVGEKELFELKLLKINFFQ